MHRGKKHGREGAEQLTVEIKQRSSLRPKRDSIESRNNKTE